MRIDQESNTFQAELSVLILFKMIESIDMTLVSYLFLFRMCRSSVSILFVIEYTITESRQNPDIEQYVNMQNNYMEGPRSARLDFIVICVDFRRDHSGRSGTSD